MKKKALFMVALDAVLILRRLIGRTFHCCQAETSTTNVPSRNTTRLMRKISSGRNRYGNAIEASRRPLIDGRRKDVRRRERANAVERYTTTSANVDLISCFRDTPNVFLIPTSFLRSWRDSTKRLMKLKLAIMNNRPHTA